MIGPRDSVRASLSLLRAHPVISISLGAAIVISLCSVCTGLGAIAGPWFVCELYGVQLAVITGARRMRSSAWARAALVVFATVLVVAATGWLSALTFGTADSSWDAGEEPLPWAETLKRVAYVAGSTTLAVGFIAPFLYAPLILIDRGGRIGGAGVESAYLVLSGGVMRHLALAFVIYAFQMSPALLTAMIVARTFERAATPIGFALAVPLVAITIPLGQGILTASYVSMRSRLASPRAVIARGVPPRSLAGLVAVVIFAPIVTLLMLGLCAIPPSPAGLVGVRASDERDGPEVEQVLALDLRDRAPGAASFEVRDTTLRIAIEGSRVSIWSGRDRTEEVPRSWGGAAIESLRVARLRSGRYRIELGGAGLRHFVVVDGAGMRTDDAIRDRLEAFIPTWAAYTMLAAFAACGVLLVRVLAPLGALRAEGEGSLEALRALREAAYRRATLSGLALLPFALAALIGGIVSSVAAWR